MAPRGNGYLHRDLGGRVFEPKNVVVVFAPYYPPAFRGGGPVRSIEALTETSPDGLSPIVLTSDRDLGESKNLPVLSNTWSRSGNAEVFYTSVGPVRHLIRALKEARSRRPIMLHFNGFLNPFFTGIPLLLWRVGFWGRVTVLISPRGEFGEGALARRSMKKRVYMWLIRLLRIDGAVLWHSTARHETLDIHRIWGDRARIVERRNDTLLSSRALPAKDASDGPLRMVFIGRIVEHKGLAIALEALQSVAERVEFHVYGVREDLSYFMRCEALASKLPGHIAVTFHDVLPPELVVDALGRHDVLALPTAGENFGHVIAEALSASCSVITTPFTPWTSALRSGGGIVVEDRSPRSWSLFIGKLAREDPDLRFARRMAAGQAYNHWSERRESSHLWAMALDVAHVNVEDENSE